MIEFILGAVGAMLGSAGGLVLVRKARGYHGGWSDEDLAAINRRRTPGTGSATEWLADSQATKDRAAALGYDTQGAPEGYGYTQRGDGTWILVKLPEAALRPPPYDGPRGR